MTIRVVYGAAVLVLGIVTIWGFFDIHDRFPIVLMVQAVVLMLRAVWKISKRT